MLGKEALKNIDNSKKPTISSTEHFNSRKFWILRNVFQNLFFHKLISR